ncbi:MAG: phospho-sugar mutase [Pseudonocardiaceae bacterium]|nr:phospho-sugar mutase [Pseudonocardiaceae bacterium]
MKPAVRDAALRWIADDVDTGDRAELQQILASALAGDTGAAAELTDRMAGPLRFGTAGLRGPLRAGPAGMNRAVVTRTTAGLASWLHQQGRTGTIVVGRDARHSSDAFAADVAGVFAAAGFDAVMLPRALPTPVLAFAVRRLGAVAGVQVTASHNPPGDNGYKVYLGDDDARGAQLAPPTDAAIEAAIAAAPAAVAVPVSAEWHTTDEQLVEAYVERVASLPRGAARRLRIAATPLHGVGGPVLLDALRRAGFTDVHLVTSQADPDPDFPTVAFPNPEEPGAADALLALADEVAADVAIALDPDADRFALGVPDGGRWRMLRGDETGVLLGEQVLAGLDRQAHPDPLVASTIVSSRLLRSVAAGHGARYGETRTGFKWLVRSGDGAGTGLVYAYEEALGHCVDPDVVRDKDGISAALLACDLAATARVAGRSVTDLLDALALTHGVHQTDAVSVWLPDHAAVTASMAALRQRPPAELGGVPVTVEDLLHDPRRPDDTIVLRADGLRVAVRPSGTEPKLKAYLEVIEPVSGDRLDAARQAAGRRLTALHDATLQRIRNP